MESVMVPEQSDPHAVTEVRLLHDGDAEAVRKLFKEVFKHEMSPELWHWKYRAQDGHAVGVFRDGELVCHYGGAGATILFKGKSAKALQSVDLMVKPSVRHLIRKQSPFFLASVMFLEQFIGYGKPYLLGYGFPSRSAMALSERLGVFGPVGQMAEVSWQVDAPIKPDFFIRSIRVTLENFDRFRLALDELWVQFSSGMQDYIVVQKDASYVKQRYLQRPGIEYCIILARARFTGRALGIVVLKQEPERVLLMDIISSSRNFVSMLQMAMWQTGLLKRKTLVSWCNKIFVERFAINNMASRLLPFIIPANTWTPAPTPAELQDRWWLMPGDTDYL
jgi:hypothetical protein